MKPTSLFLCAAALSVVAWGQVPNPTQSQTPIRLSDTPIFRVTATAHTMKAINFNHRDGSTTVGLMGTSLMPKAIGDVKVDSKTGATKIDVHVDKMEAAQLQGGSFLTFVLWAVTPEGRAENLGEIVLDGDTSRLQASTELQAFGLIVTAEPYFAVTQPSDTVVMEGVIKPSKGDEKGTSGTITYVDAKYELLEHGSYDAVLPLADQAIVKQKNDLPLDLKQARHAMAIARGVGAQTYATDTMTRANNDLANAEAIWNSRKDTKRVQTLSRNVAQLAEDARIITVRKLQEQRLAEERNTAQQNIAAAKSEADRQTAMRVLAETEQKQALAREAQAKEVAQREAAMRLWAESQQAELAQARNEAQTLLAKTQTELSQSRTDANQARAAAAASQTQALADREAASKAAAEAAAARAAAAEAQAARASTDSERIQAVRDAEAARMAATKAREEAMLAKNQADAALQARLTTEADRERLRAEKEAADRKAAESEAARAQAEAERIKLRIEIRDQLNKVLQTKESARGLIVNLSDVLFDTAQYNLKPGAREKLAKVSGILLAHPDLTIQVEGHTDSVGTDEYNQKLSENRAKTVCDFLKHEGVAEKSVSFKGFGKTQPVADNATAAGRQQNRRVELIVAGESIQTSSR